MRKEDYGHPFTCHAGVSAAYFMLKPPGNVPVGQVLRRGSNGGKGTHGRQVACNAGVWPRGGGPQTTQHEVQAESEKALQALHLQHGVYGERHVNRCGMHGECHVNIRGICGECHVNILECMWSNMLSDGECMGSAMLSDMEFVGSAMLSDVECVGSAMLSDVECMGSDMLIVTCSPPKFWKTGVPVPNLIAQCL